MIHNALKATQRNSARVIGLFGRKVPSENPFRIHLVVYSSISALANEASTSENFLYFFVFFRAGKIIDPVSDTGSVDPVRIVPVEMIPVQVSQVEVSQVEVSQVEVIAGIDVRVVTENHVE